MAPILVEIVLQFDTAADTLTVERYFRHARPLWPVTGFAVPSRLASGYGQYQGPRFRLGGELPVRRRLGEPQPPI